MIWILFIAATLPLTVAYMAARHIDAIQRSWYRPPTSEPGDDWGGPHSERYSLPTHTHDRALASERPAVVPAAHGKGASGEPRSERT